MKNYLIALFLIGIIATPAQAHAADSGVLSEAVSLLAYAYIKFRTGAYILAAVGVFIVAILSFFGNFQMKRLLFVCFGVFMISSIDNLLVFLHATPINSSASSAAGSYSDMASTLGNADGDGSEEA